MSVDDMGAVRHGWTHDHDQTRPHRTKMPVACLDLGGPKDIVTPQSGVIVNTGGLNSAQVAAQLADQGFMAEANQGLQNAQLLGQAQSPPSSQPHVIVVFRFDAGGSAKYILGIQDFEEIDETNMPTPVLLADRHLERGCGRALSASGVDVNEIDGFQRHLRIRPAR